MGSIFLSRHWRGQVTYITIIKENEISSYWQYVMPNIIFPHFDVGQYGSNNDSGLLAQSKIGLVFENNTLNIPQQKIVPGTEMDIRYSLVREVIFPLKH